MSYPPNCRVSKTDDNNYTCHKEDRLVAEARREGLGDDWRVYKIQWRGANGCNEYGGFPGAPLLIATVSASAAHWLQDKLVRSALMTIGGHRG